MGRLFLSVQKLPQGIIHGIDLRRNLVPLENSPVCTVTDDLDKLDEVTGRDNFCLFAPISYAGKSRHSDNARFIYAIAIDMDGIEKVNNLEVLFNQIEENQFFIDGGVF